MKYVLLFIFILLQGCDFVLPVEKRLSLSLPDVERVIWTLTSLEVDGDVKDASEFSPFRLVFTDSLTYTGDDGCNSYYGTYTADQEEIYPTFLGITLLSCEQLEVSTLHLTDTFSVHLEAQRLEVESKEGLYTYHSIYFEPVNESPLVEGKWHLAGSNNPAVAALEGAFIPHIVFQADRSFALRWRCVPENYLGCNEYSGFWGRSRNDHIILYDTRGRVSNASHFSEIVGILDAHSFALNGKELTLYNGATEYYLEQR